MLLWKNLVRCATYLNDISPLLLSVVDDYSVDLSISQFILMKDSGCIIYSLIVSLLGGNLRLEAIEVLRLSDIG